MEDLLCMAEKEIVFRGFSILLFFDFDFATFGVFISSPRLL